MNKKLEKLNLTGVITLGSRMKRLSDLVFQQVQEVYDSHCKDFKASWFSVLATIKEEESIDFKSLAAKHSVSSSAVSQTIKELEKQDLVKVITGADKRSRLITLSDKGENVLQEAYPILLKIQEVLNEMLGNEIETFINLMENFEEDLRRKSLIQRVEVKIVNYSEDYKKQFKTLNLSWLKEHFEITKLDNEILDNPEKFTKEKGGEIFLALKNKELVGTLALIPHQDSDSLEISKMAVSEDLRGRGIAKLLLQEAINFAKERSFNTLFALTSSKLNPAMQFYRKNNFEESNFKDTRYERVDKRFSMTLNN